MLFRHMAFNAAVGNVDDHSQNFGMLATAGGYRLAPAFDLVPTSPAAVSARSRFNTAPLAQRAINCAPSQTNGECRKPAILDEVVDTVGAFGATARRLGVRPSAGLEWVRADIRRRAKLMSMKAPNSLP